MRKPFDLKAPKSIVALCWMAGLSMRFALRAQQDLGHVQPQDLIYPRGGPDYPLTRQELEWQLDFWGSAGRIIERQSQTEIDRVKNVILNGMKDPCW